MPSAKDKETAERKRKLQKVLKIRKSINIMTSLLLEPKDAVRSALFFLDRPRYGAKKFWNCEFFSKLITIRVESFNNGKTHQMHLTKSCYHHPRHHHQSPR